MRTVLDIVNIRHLAAEGLKATQIALRLSIHRTTVAKYLQLPEVPAKVQRQRVAHKIDPYTDHIMYRLALYPELTAERLYREIAKLGYKGSRRSVRRFVAQVRPLQLRTYRPVETPPGQQAQVDWGSFGTTVDEGQTLKVYAFVVVLSHSRMRYVEFTTSQDTATFLACHSRAFGHFGGVPHEIIYDNAKTVVQERVGTVIRFHADLLRFAAAHGYKPRACWMEDPESKGKVENGIGYLRRDFFYGTEFAGVDDMNQQRWIWLNEVANAKLSEATGRTPAEALAEERPFLLPLPAQPVEIAMEQTARITKTCLLRWGGNEYSVPDTLARRKVVLHVYEDRLQVLWEGAVVVTLPRLRGKGRRLIQEEHYKQRKRGPGSRGDSLQRRFEAIGPAAPAYLAGLARTRQGHLREQAEGIVGLCQIYGQTAVHGAMERAAAFGAYSYGTVKRILEKLERGAGTLPEQPAPGLPVTVGIPVVAVQERSLLYYAEAAGQRR